MYLQDELAPIAALARTLTGAERGYVWTRMPPLLLVDPLPEEAPRSVPEFPSEWSAPHATRIRSPRALPGVDDPDRAVVLAFHAEGVVAGVIGVSGLGSGAGPVVEERLGALLPFVEGRMAKAESRFRTLDVDQDRDYFLQILDNIELDLVVFDGEGRFEWVNRSSIGDPVLRKWLVGRTNVDYCLARSIDPALGRERDESVRRVLETGRPHEVEEVITTPGGEPRHFVRKVVPVRGADQRVERLLGFGLDITDQKRAEAALEIREAELHQAQKMEAVGRLAGGIAHDFNNVLTAVRGRVHLLQEEGPGSPNWGEDLREIQKAADRAEELVRRLLTFSRTRTAEPRSVDLNSVVQETERLLFRVLGEDVRLSTRLDPGLPEVEVDPGQMSQVLLNLVVNSRDAMPNGGTIRISTRNHAQPEGAASSRPLLAPGPYVVLEVEDSGHGIPPEVLSKVFEPFFTTKEEGKGTGLGLSTVYGIVAQAGGQVEMDSEEGRGTVVRILLPAARASSGEEGRAQGAGGADSSRLARLLVGAGETVLLVEDEESVRRLAQTTLARYGYQVVTAENGETALAAIREHPEPIHLLLTDVVMPGMNGRELVEAVHRIRPGLPVLYMTGYTQDEVLLRGVAEDPDLLLRKPFTMRDLLRRVRKLLDRRGGLPHEP